MLFNSWQFICVFLPITLALFYSVPHDTARYRKLLLLFASIAFYGYWNWHYLFLLGASIGGNYLVAHYLACQARFRRGFLLAGIIANLALLVYYKYSAFFLEQWSLISGSHPTIMAIILPLAISFFTFTQIAYLVDVFRDRSLHYSFFDYALFAVFFPHLIAGPIVRHWELIPQFSQLTRRVTQTDLAAGILLFLIGLFKKMFFADSLVPYSDAVFSQGLALQNLTFFDAWLGTLCFGLQIYFDFSAYSDMAIGLARLFGIKLPMNFDSPYKATSIIEFWRRWHITLMRFFREYVYFPMGGSRMGQSRTILNLLVVMLLSGLWHGAAWHFVLWGLFHGILLAGAHLWTRHSKSLGPIKQNRLYLGVCLALTFCLVTLGWVLFRAGNLSQSLHFYNTMFGGAGLSLPATLTHPDKPFGTWLQSLGFVFVQNDLGFSDQAYILKLLCALLLVVLFMPNSQQLLAAAEPVLEPVRDPARIQILFRPASGLIFGALFFFAVRMFFGATPSPFIYFNF